MSTHSRHSLSDDEINDIINTIPDVKAISSEIAQNSKINIIDDFTKKLKKVSLSSDILSKFISSLKLKISTDFQTSAYFFQIPYSANVMGSIADIMIDSILTSLSPMRVLTSEEINSILSIIPTIRAATGEISNVSRNNIILAIRNNLTTFKVNNDIVPEFISQLKNKIYNSFKKAETKPGTPVGSHAAESIAVPMIQGTLDSFKTTGSSISTYGEETSREIIALSNRNPEIIKIFFNHPISDVEILRDKRPDLVEVNVEDLIDPKLKYEIGDPFDIIGQEEPYWYSIHRRTIEKNSEFELGSRMMRLHLNVNLMLEKKITPTKITKTILGYKIKTIVKTVLGSKTGVNKQSVNEDEIICIPSPIMTSKKKMTVLKTVDGEVKQVQIEGEIAFAYIDIFPIKNEYPGITDIYQKVVDTHLRTTLSKETWLDIILAASFKDMHIKGIKGINGIFLERSNVVQIINDQKPENEYIGNLNLTPIQQFELVQYLFLNNPSVYDTLIRNILTEAQTNISIISNNKIRIWKLFFSKRRIKAMGIGQDKLIHLLQLCGIVILPYTEEEQANGDNILYMKVILPIRTDDYNKVMFESLYAKIEAEKEKLKNKPTEDESKLIQLESQLKQAIDEEVTPLKWIDYYYTMEKNSEKEVTKDKLKEIEQYASNSSNNDFSFSKRQEKDPNTSVVLAYEVVYAVAQGKNLKEILKRSDVDPRRTYSNDFYEIYNNFGIEGLRNFILEELVGYSSVIGTDSVSARHLTILADFMTYRGVPTKITFTGLQDDFEETAKSVGFERPYPVLAEAASIGKSEATLTNIASVMLGKVANVGADFVDTAITPHYRKKMESEFKLLSVEDMIKGIEDYEDFENGIDAVDLPDNFQPIPVDVPEAQLQENIPAGVFEGQVPVEEIQLNPLPVQSDVSKEIIKNTMNRLVPISQIYSQVEMESIVVQPLRETALISQMPIAEQQQQEITDIERLSVPAPTIDVGTDIFPGLADILQEGAVSEIPVDF